MQLTVDLPEAIGRRVRRLRDPNRFVAETLTRALPAASEGERAPRGDLSKEDRRRWASKLRSTFEIEGKALPIEAIQEMSHDSDLEDNELSRGLVKAREE